MEKMKFRFWDKFNGCMVYSRKYKNLADYFNLRQDLIDAGNGIVDMMFIFKKDSRGKELYGGDAVKVDYPDDSDFMGADQHYISYIYYDTESASFMIRRPVGADSLEGSTGKEIEILGNLFENPELLERINE